MDTVLDRLERSIEDNIELENDLGIDAESYGIQELQNRYELFDNIKNEAFRLDNENALSDSQKERIDKITDTAYDKANQFNLIAERKRQEYFELGKRRIEINRQIKRLENAIEKDSNIVNVQVAEGYEKPESLAKLQEEARNRMEENEMSLNDLRAEKTNIIQKMRDLQFGERPKAKDIDKIEELNSEEEKSIENDNDLDNEIIPEAEEQAIEETLDGQDSNSDNSGESSSDEPDEIEEHIEPLQPVNEEVEEQEEEKEEDKEEDKSKEEPEEEENIELDDEPVIPNVKSNKPKITWKTILHVAAGIGIGAAVFFTAGPLGVGVMSLAGGLANKFLKQRRNEIARLNSLGISTKINTVVEPRPGIKGLVDRVKNKFRTEEGLRDMSWMINSAIITGTTLTVASTVNNLIQARNTAVPSVESTPQTNTPSVEPKVTPEPTPLKATPEPVVQQPVSQYDGIRIGEGVGDYNVSVGHISSDRAVMGLDTKPLLSQYVNKDSIFGRFASVNPDGSIGQVINTNGLSIEEFCTTNGIDPSRVAVSVMDKAGTDQAWISASELVSGMGGPTL
jgi:hypothetical protein